MPILLTLLLLMLILNHAKDESKSEVEKKLFEGLSGKEYGDGKPTLNPLPAPTGNARDYPGDEPSTAPPPNTPIWCPPPEEGYGPPPPYPGADKCVY